MIDLIIVLVFIVYSVGNGFYNQARASKNLEEYFLAGRSIKGWRAGFSMAATQYAADTPLLMAGLIATGGIFMLWRLWIYGLGFLMIGFLLGGPWRHARVITLGPDRNTPSKRCWNRPVAVRNGHCSES